MSTLKPRLNDLIGRRIKAFHPGALGVLHWGKLLEYDEENDACRIDFDYAFPLTRKTKLWVPARHVMPDTVE